MLQPADAELVRRRPDVPELGAVLDPAALDELVAGLLPDGLPRPAAVRAARVRLAAGATAELTVDHPAGRHVLGLRAPAATRENPADTGGAEGPAPDATAGLAPPGWPGLLSDPGSGVTVTAPTHDPALSAILRVAGSPAAYGGPGAATLHTLRFRQGERWTGRIDDAEGRPLAAVRCRPGGVNVAAHIALAAAGIAVPDLIRVNRFGVVSTAWLEGDLATARDGDDVLAGIGELLARVHAVPPPRELPAPGRGEAAGAERAAQAVGRLLPKAAQRAAGLARACAPGPEDGPAVLSVGGAPGGYVATARGVALLHPGRARAAHPATDLAAAAAARIAAGAATAGGGAEAALGPLWEGYRAAADPGFVEAVRPALSRATAGALLRIAHAPFASRSPDWPERIGALLGDAEALLMD
ncbi:hypothetical protein ACFOVU_13745 [Nocardiopsis sediminis]|uniref:Aminoglycoside phosphotransferase domain-containing protein n=1 Tax=Nocardiopsis sediminis TaxID=1778267 RepID=A0ABV8FNM2_9ACTN